MRLSIDLPTGGSTPLASVAKIYSYTGPNTINPATGEPWGPDFPVITVKDWQSRHGRKIAQKHLDFVLITYKATRIVAAIELNDATHDSTSRQQRDEFIEDALASARIPLVTFPIYQEYDPAKIRRQIFIAVAKIRTDRRPSDDR